jgi:DNA polymerase
MAKPDIFDEIISYLKNNSQIGNGRTTISPELCQHFFTDTPKTPTQQPVQQPNNQWQQTSKPATQQQSSTQMMAAIAQTAPPQQLAPMPDLSQCDLATLQQTAISCTSCPLYEHRTNVVFGDGNPNAELMFIDEIPGYHEDMQGLPAVGDAGNLLTKMIAAMQYSRTDVYITNIVKCRPPNSRNPQPAEANCCLTYLNRQIELIKPRAIVLFGPVPLKSLLNLNGIKAHRGQWLEYRGIPVIATFSPAYLLRFKAAKGAAWHDLQMVMQLLET